MNCWRILPGNTSNNESIPASYLCLAGGEPALMGIEFYQKAVNDQKKYALPGLIIENTFQTNGTLLDDKWCAFFKENNFLIGISIDGPPELHNIYRKHISGKGSSDPVLKGLGYLKKHDVDFKNIICTAKCMRVMETTLWMFTVIFGKSWERVLFSLSRLSKRDNKTGFQEGNKLTKRSISAKLYGDFLITIFDEWVRCDVGSVFVQLFDVRAGEMDEYSWRLVCF